MKTNTWQIESVRALLRAGVAVALVMAAVAARAAQRSEVLAAIHLIENPRDSRRAGPGGELGAYQFREATWRMHTAEPFARALEREVSDEVAARHYQWIVRGLGRARVPATAAKIALAWNAGLGAAIRGRAPATARDYAERVANVATELGRGVAMDGR